MMEKKHNVRWGESAIGESITKEEKKDLLAEIDKLAATSNCFRIEIRSEAVDFLRKTLENAYVAVLSVFTNKTSVVIAINRSTAETTWDKLQ